MMKIKNKRGQQDVLIPETVKIVLAVLCIIGLIYLATLLFGIFNKQTQTEQAKGALNEITGQFSVMREGEQKEYLYIAPNKWFITSGVVRGPISECQYDHCLCLCKERLCPSGKDVVCAEISKDVVFQNTDGSAIIDTFTPQMFAPKSLILVNNKETYSIKMEMK